MEEKQVEEKVINLSSGREEIEIRVKKCNSPEGIKMVVIRFISHDKMKGGYGFDQVFVRKVDGSYELRDVIDGVYDAPHGEDQPTSEGFFEVSSDNEIEEIVENLIEKRKEYLANLWSGEKIYRYIL